MKILILSIIALSLPAVASAEFFISGCELLYRTGWDNMTSHQQMEYVVWCKPYGWA